MRHGNQIGLAMAIVLIAGNSFAEVPQAFAKQARTFAPPSCADGNETVDKPEVSALMMMGARKTLLSASSRAESEP